MDDLSAKINEIMSDPQKLKEIQNLGKMMGLTGDGNNTQVSNSTDSQGAAANKNNSTQGDNPLSVLGGIDPGVIGKIAPLLSSLNREDETTRLFDALAPFLSSERQEKLEKIKKMMVIIKLLPNIKNLGLF